MSARAFIDEIRSLAFGDITGDFVEIGDPLTVLARIVCFNNNTDADLMFTDDETKEKIFVPAGGYKLIDVQSNMNAQFDDKYLLPVGTQFWVKRIEAITLGNAYIEVWH